MLDPTPLSERELDQLDRFLLDAPSLENAMSISMLDGFLAAIVCAPRMSMPSEWLGWVWDAESGKTSPKFKSAKQAERILSLVMRHMNDISRTLRTNPEIYEPLLMENPNDGEPIPIIDDWCSGFMRGVELDRAGWKEMLSGSPESLAFIELYGTEHGMLQLLDERLTLQAHRAIADGLGETVRVIHALSLAGRVPFRH